MRCKRWSARCVTDIVSWNHEQCNLVTFILLVVTAVITDLFWLVTYHYFNSSRSEEARYICWKRCNSSVRQPLPTDNSDTSAEYTCFSNQSNGWLSCRQGAASHISEWWTLLKRSHHRGPVVFSCIYQNELQGNAPWRCQHPLGCPPLLSQLYLTSCAWRMHLAISFTRVVIAILSQFQCMIKEVSICLI